MNRSMTLISRRDARGTRTSKRNTLNKYGTMNTMNVIEDKNECEDTNYLSFDSKDLNTY